MISLQLVSYLLFSLIVFPGLVFLVALAFFTEYWVRKTSARMQRRMGPSYVGPAGLLQPFYDFLKLVRYKEFLGTRYSMTRVAEISILVGLSTLVASMLLFPLSPIRIIGNYDFLVFIYLTGIMLPVTLIITSLAMPGPYTVAGVSRLISFIIIVEPAYFTALLVPLILVMNITERQLSIYYASTYSWMLWLNPFTLLPMILATISALVVLQAKAMYPPFNIPEAEQELIAGFETEFSGPLLGLVRLVHEVEVVVSAIAIVYLLLGGPYPFPHFSIQGVIVLIIKYLAVITLLSVIKNLYGRFRIEQGLYAVFKYSLIPALIAAFFATIYLAIT